MNVYDFDQTIYRHDSTADFIVWLMTHCPKTWLNLPRMLVALIPLALHIYNTQTFKEQLYHMFIYVDNMEEQSEKFVESHMNLIKPFYLEQHRPDDVVISASPLFNIEKFCKRLGITHVIASNVDMKTGKTQGLNCHDQEKVRRFREIYGDAKIENFYSDSLHDSPLAMLAEKAWLVKGDSISPWPDNRVG